MAHPLTAAAHLSRKAMVRLMAAHKPLVRRLRRGARAAEQEAMLRQALEAEQEITGIAAADGPIIAGPWLGEVGYEALYWVPFLRWVCDRHRIDPERLVVVSRGGVAEWYAGLSGRYVEIFDLLTPDELAARNAARQAADEAGGRKQSRPGELDDLLLAKVNGSAGRASVLHPSLMFRLFRDVWQGHLPLEFLFTRADFVPVAPPPRPSLPGLPGEYVAVKFYSGTALPSTAENLEAVRSLVRRVASRAPVVTLDTGLAVDDHRDYALDGIPGVISARPWLTPRTNLGVQSALVAHAKQFIGTCGGLAWLAPFMGVPTAAVYADDRQLGPHLMIARLAGRRVQAADFAPLDLRAVRTVLGEAADA